MINSDDLEAFGYYDGQGKPTHKTPMEMVEEYQSITKQVPSPSLYEVLMKEEFQEWLDAESGSLEELKEMADLIYVTYGRAYAKGWDLGEALRRVHKNNMGRMYQEDGTIKRREDGKIVKRPGYPKVSLGDLV
jgi:predicted HAD superfamily Cof-like phosphohydrolase